jgi:hypothetical protein
VNSKLPFDDDDVQTPVPGLILLSEEDFSAALKRAADVRNESKDVLWAPLDSGAIEAGAVIAGRANLPSTHGVFARVERSNAGVPFEGRLFGILSDPAFDESGRVVSARNFRIAALELKGSASWIGVDARLSGSNAPAEPDHCCGTPTVCVSRPGDDEPPVLMPSARVGVTTTMRELYQTRARRDPEAGTVGYTVYGSSTLNSGRPEPVPPGDGSPASPAGVPAPQWRDPVGTDLVCLEVLDPGCGIAKPLCGPDDIGFVTLDDNAADLPIGSSFCADELTRPVRGLNVPEACTYAYFSDPTDPACRGTYGGPPRHGNPFAGLGDAVRDASDSLFCRIARWIPGAGSPCETTTERYETARNAALALELGGVLPGESKTQCTPTGERGIERCVTCANDGGETKCSEMTKVPLLDPTVAESADDPIDTEAGGFFEGFNVAPGQRRQPLVQRDPPLSDPPLVPAEPASDTPPPPRTPEPAGGPAGPPPTEPAPAQDQ